MKGICVGMGGRGKMWVDWARAAGMEVAGVVDLNEQVLQAAADELDLPAAQCFARIGEAAVATGAKVATICTANAAHFGCVEECLDAGLHCIVEKPMVESPEQARRIVAMAREKGLTVAVAQNYRYTPEVQAMRAAVQDHLIGQVLTLDVFFARWRPAGDMALPLMLNQAIHHFDAGRHILGADPTWCFARSWNPDWSPSTGPTLLQANWGMTGSPFIGHNDQREQEAVFTYHGNYVHQGEQTPYSGQWRIIGSTGTLTYLHQADDTRLILTRRDPEERQEIPIHRAQTLSEPSQVCRDFLQAVEQGRKAPTSAGDNIKSLGMIWAAQRSSDERRMVSVKEIVG